MNQQHNVTNFIKTKKALHVTEELFTLLAVWTGLEPATPCVTGTYSNQLNYQTSALLRVQIYIVFLLLHYVFTKK